MTDSPTPSEGARLLLHASCVAVDRKAALLRGPSGIGKSDLALRLIDQGAELVSDDQVVLCRSGNQILAAPPPTLAGMIEVRGIGIIRMPWSSDIPVAAVFDLQREGEIDRLPSLDTMELHRLRIPLFRIKPEEPSAPAKVRLVLRRDGHGLGSSCVERRDAD